MVCVLFFDVDSFKAVNDMTKINAVAAIPSDSLIIYDYLDSRTFSRFYDDVNLSNLFGF